jgi:hypothetical protein
MGPPAVCRGQPVGPDGVIDSRTTKTFQTNAFPWGAGIGPGTRVSYIVVRDKKFHDDDKEQDIGRFARDTFADR